MKKVTVNTGLFAVLIDGHCMTEEGLNPDISLAEHYTADQVYDIINEWRWNMPKAVVTIQPALVDMPFDEFTELIADIYNNPKNSWDWLHNGVHRDYSIIHQIIDSDVLYSITPEVVAKFVPAMLKDIELPMTIEQYAKFMADSVAQAVVKHPYSDVSFHIYIK